MVDNRVRRTIGDGDETERIDDVNPRASRSTGWLSSSVRYTTVLLRADACIDKESELEAICGLAFNQCIVGGGVE